MELQQLLDKANDRLNQVHPNLRDKANKLIKLAYENGLNICITQGYRSIEEQNALYNKGRFGNAGPIVTNAKGGTSYHNYRLAFDIAVYNDDGSIDWDTEWKYTKVGQLGESIGLEWGGSWSTFKDMPHFQLTFGLTINQLLNGAAIPEYQPEEDEEVVEEVNVFLNGTELPHGFIKDDKAYVPVRVIAEALGLKVQWVGETKSVVLTKE